MVYIKHKLTLKATADKVFDALTTQEGLQNWWAKQTVAKPAIGFVNEFTFGSVKNEMEITRLTPGREVAWKVLASSDEWVNTTLSFQLETKEDKTILRFTHDGWKSATDFYAECNYAWGKFMTSLKAYCETGTGTPV